MNIYEKIQTAKEKLLKLNIKKSGKNSFSNFSYYELADIMPPIIGICNELKLYTHVSFTDELATLTIYDGEKDGDTVQHTSPMRTLELKGCNAIQALGGVETYQRRYLFMMAFDIIEADSFDAAAGSDKNAEKKPESKENASKSTASKKTESNGKQDLDGKITDAQAKRMYAIARNKGGEYERTHEEAIEILKATQLHFGYEQSKDILVKDYEKICKQLESEAELPF